MEEGVRFCSGCGKNISGAPNDAPASAAQQQTEAWWEKNYSPIPHEQVAATLRATLTPREIVVATSKIHWTKYVLLVLGTVLALVLTISFSDVIGVLGRETGFPVMMLVVLAIIIYFLIRLSQLRRSMIVITDQRFLGAFYPKIFSTNKLDIPLRSVDSFAVFDNIWGNLLGFTRIKLMSRASTYSFSGLTRDSCQSIKNAYYDWDAKQSR